MADLFKDIIPSILQNKKDVLIDEKDYFPYLINKALSYHMDCILYANEMNTRPQLDKDMQYQYLKGSVRGYKRKFQKWEKLDTPEDLKLVKQHYKFSNEKAREAMKVLTPDQIEAIRASEYRGGLEPLTK